MHPSHRPIGRQPQPASPPQLASGGKKIDPGEVDLFWEVSEEDRPKVNAGFQTASFSCLSYRRWHLPAGQTRVASVRSGRKRPSGSRARAALPASSARQSEPPEHDAGCVPSRGAVESHVEAQHAARLRLLVTVVVIQHSFALLLCFKTLLATKPWNRLFHFLVQAGRSTYRNHARI